MAPHEDAERVALEDEFAEAAVCFGVVVGVELGVAFGAVGCLVCGGAGGAVGCAVWG